MEHCDLPHKELKIALIRKSNELQENIDNSTKSGKQFLNEMRDLKKIKSF